MALRVPQNAPPPSKGTDAKVVARNTLVSLLGAVGKASAPLYLAVTTRLYGIELFGIFVTAQALCELGMTMLTSGFNDAALMNSAQRAADRALEEDTDEARARAQENDAHATHMLATSLFWVIALSAGVLLPLAFTTPWALKPFYEWSDTLSLILMIMAFGVPLFGLSRIFVASTIGHQDLRFDAIVNGIVRPGSLLVGALVYHFTIGGAVAIALAWTTSQACGFLVALYGFLRYESVSVLVGALRAKGLEPSVLRFAVPQSLSVSFQRFAGSLGLIMLGMMGVSSALVGIFGAALQIVENAIYTVRYVFTNVFNPWVPRYLRSGARGELSNLVTDLATQSTIACGAVTIALALFEREVMALFVPDYPGSEGTFAALLIGPWLIGAFGLMGSVIVLAGHSAINLMNTAIVFTINLTLNLLWIPIYGPLGAALGTAVATVVLCVLQAYQARRLEKVTWRMRAFLAPLLGTSALIAGAIAVANGWTMIFGLRLAIGMVFALALALVWWSRPRLAELTPPPPVEGP